MKTAIVTGANGFIGKALLKELTNFGITVYAVIKNKNSDIDAIVNLPGVEIVYCDMSDLTQLPQKINVEKPDVFYHLAWTGSTGSERADYALQITNARYTVDAVNVAKMLGCKRFLGAGTLAELDVNAYSPLDGSMPNSVSCYGVAKIAAHLMSKAECNRVGIDHLWAYLSNTYGVGNYTSNFINFAAKIMLTGQPTNFTTGEQQYDFVNVRDIAQGLHCIGENGKTNYAYYIGSTKPMKLKEFIKIIRNEIDPSIKLNLGAVPFNGISQPEEVFNCTKLVEHTGYTPHVLFKEGIHETVTWLREQIREGKL